MLVLSQPQTGPAEDADFMCTEQYAVRFMDTAGSACCPACGEHQPECRGPRLYQAGHDQPLCRGCARRLAPHLGALLELAATAERLGRPCRHLLTPPMEVLLDLARAAENYVTITARAG